MRGQVPQGLNQPVGDRFEVAMTPHGELARLRVHDPGPHEGRLAVDDDAASSRLQQRTDDWLLEHSARGVRPAVDGDRRKRRSGRGVRRGLLRAGVQGRRRHARINDRNRSGEQAASWK